VRLGELLAMLDDVRAGQDGNHRARCPAHDDKDPSLSISQASDERLLIKCFAGCSAEDVLGALGLKLSDLFPAAQRAPVQPTILDTYDYVDERGQLLFQVVRFLPKDFRQRRPDGCGDWIWRTKGVRRVLYRLPNVIAAVGAGQPVWIVEGEKDVAALEKLGLVATTNPGGAGKWRSEYTESLRGAWQVNIVPDRDNAGHKHARQVAGALFGAVGELRIVELPRLGGSSTP
jgi:DNA primase